MIVFMNNNNVDEERYKKVFVLSLVIFVFSVILFYAVTTSFDNVIRSVIFWSFVGVFLSICYKIDKCDESLPITKRSIFFN